MQSTLQQKAQQQSDVFKACPLHPRLRRERNNQVIFFKVLLGVSSVVGSKEAALLLG